MPPIVPQATPMTGYHRTIPYRNACAVGKLLMDAMSKPTEDLKGLAAIAREWRETEQMKREWRGLPRLASASVREMMAAKRDAMKTIDATSSAPAFTEVD